MPESEGVTPLMSSPPLTPPQSHSPLPSPSLSSSPPSLLPPMEDQAPAQLSATSRHSTSPPLPVCERLSPLPPRESTTPPSGEALPPSVESQSQYPDGFMITVDHLLKMIITVQRGYIKNYTNTLHTASGATLFRMAKGRSMRATARTRSRVPVRVRARRQPTLTATRSRLIKDHAFQDPRRMGRETGREKTGRARAGAAARARCSSS
jgi:hypothetical protein